MRPLDHPSVAAVGTVHVGAQHVGAERRRRDLEVDRQVAGRGEGLHALDVERRDGLDQSPEFLGARIRRLPGVVRAEVAGSVRRSMEVVRNINIVAGSSSVTPVMESLKEAYVALNPNASIEIQQSDSTTGMNAVAEGICDIGMASRALKDSETAKGLTGKSIALDGIVVIVNSENPLSDLTASQVKDIYTGTSTFWSDLK